MIHSRTTLTHYVFSFIFFCFFVQTVSANPVKEETARKIATRFISSINPLRTDVHPVLVYSGDPHPQSVLRGDNPASLYYIYNVGKENGFIIISGEDNAFPVLGYADKGTFQAERMPENITHWLNFYQDELLFAANQAEGATKDVRGQWDALLAGQSLPSITGPTLSTVNWDQSIPYNDLCPKDSSGKTSVTGCVATAMGIAMKYHNWPDKGVGSNTYTTRTDNLSVSASFDVAYDWQNMLDSYQTVANNPSWSARQGEAVATFLYHSGVSVNMDYKSTASGAYTPDVISALEKNFKYDKGMSLLYRNLYNTAEWNALLREELDNNRPVIYGGATKDNSGHLFIVDGYATSGNYFHINWGWSGYSNGFYLLSSLQPSWQGIGGNKEGEGYSYLQDALIGMKKAEKDSYTNNELYFYYQPEIFTNSSYGLSTDISRIEQDKPFLLFYTYISDYGNRDFHGELAVIWEDKNSNAKDTLCIMATDEEGLPAGYAYFEPEGIPLIIEGEVEEGDVIRMYYRPEGYDWRPLRGESNATTEIPVYKINTTSITQPSRREDISSEIGDGKFTVNFPQDITINDIHIHTIRGQKVMQKSYNSNLSPVITDLSGLGDGLYIITIRTSEGLISRKIKLSNP